MNSVSNSNLSISDGPVEAEKAQEIDTEVSIDSQSLEVEVAGSLLSLCTSVPIPDVQGIAKVEGLVSDVVEEVRTENKAGNGTTGTVAEAGEETNPYAYLSRDEFSSERFKIEVKGLPRFYGFGVRKYTNRFPFEGTLVPDLAGHSRGLEGAVVYVLSYYNRINTNLLLF